MAVADVQSTGLCANANHLSMFTLSRFLMYGWILPLALTEMVHLDPMHFDGGYGHMTSISLALTMTINYILL